MKPITYAYLETTNHCNLACSFCNRDEVIGPLRHMSLDKWAELLDSIKHHPIQTAKLMGMGEPMLHPHFDEVCQMFKETFPNCFVIVATNCQYPIKEGTKIRTKFERSLKYIDMLYLSIDGYEESYERDRAPAKWPRLMAFLEDFKTIDRGICNVTVNYVVNAYNIDDIERVDALRREHNLGQLRLNMAQLWDEGSSITENIATSGYSEEQLTYLRENWSEQIMGKSEWDYDECFWVDQGLYTTVEGNVKMCCMNTGAKPFGNLFEQSLDQIRTSNDYLNVQTGCKTKNPTSHCKNCSYKELAPVLKHLQVKNI